MERLKKEVKALQKQINELSKRTEKMLNLIEKAGKTASKPATKRGAKKKTSKKKKTAVDAVFEVIKRSIKGVNTAKIKEKTGFKEKKIWDTVNRLKKQGLVKSKGKGIYIKA